LALRLRFQSAHSGPVWKGHANHRVLAFCDAQLHDWYSYDIGSHWKALIVEPA
jgi:hypothetical protein